MRIRYRYRGNEKIFDRSAEAVVLGRPRPGVHVDIDLTPDLRVSRPHARISVAKGDYFISTGEILIPDVELRGAGEVVIASATVSYTFPLRMAEIVWGDGTAIHHKTIPLDDTHEFGNRKFRWEADANGWKWARLAVWDVAGNGAFTNPIWRSAMAQGN